VTADSARTELEELLTSALSRTSVLRHWFDKIEVFVIAIRIESNALEGNRSVVFHFVEGNQRSVIKAPKPGVPQFAYAADCTVACV
jgi:hypothetical protein